MLYDEDYTEKGFRLKGCLDPGYRMTVRLEGRGSGSGTRAFLRMLTEMHRQVPQGHRSDALLDCTSYGGTPLRSQLSIGRWLLGNTGKTGRVALAGAQPLEEKIGRAVMKMAGITRISFFDDEDAARTWLGWT